MSEEINQNILFTGNGSRVGYLKTSIPLIAIKNKKTTKIKLFTIDRSRVGYLKTPIPLVALVGQTGQTKPKHLFLS